MTLLHSLYRLSGALSACFLAGIAVLILAQIVARLAGTQIPSADDFAAWSMAGAVFLALPATFTADEHIRVTILFRAFGPAMERVLDGVSTVIAIGILSWGTYYIGEYVYESYIYHDVSQGIIAVPLWIPQLAMVFGMLLMTLAMIEHFYLLITGGNIFPDKVESAPEDGV